MAKIIRKPELNQKKITTIQTRCGSNTNRVSRLPNYMKKKREG